MKRSQSHGLTLFELMVGLSVFSLLALMIGAIGVRGFHLSRENQTSLSSQQDMAFALRHFSEDVRKAIGMVSSTSDPSRFVLRQPSGTDGSLFVTYRFTGTKLQRGESPSPTATPASWLDVIDAAGFEVLQGRFSYFTMGGEPTSESDLVRRIDLIDLKVRSLQTRTELDIPTLSAAMREGSYARALRIDAGSVWATPNGKHLRFRLENPSGRDIPITYFSLVWPETMAANPLKKLSFQGFEDWQESRHSMGALPTTVTLPSAGSLEVDLLFDDHMDLPASFTLNLFGPKDKDRINPFSLSLEPLSIAGRSNGLDGGSNDKKEENN